MTRLDRARRALVLSAFVLGAPAWAAAPDAAPVASASATAPPGVVAPDRVGLSAERLAKLGAVLQADVDAGKIPGAVMLVARRGELAWFEAFGKLDPARDAPMTRDAIFRIYSMTKPITSVAAMMLVEDGKLHLSDPVSRYIPEYAKLTVGVEKAGADGKPALETVPARRPMTVQDLLRHTSGLTYGFFGPGLVKKAYQEAGLNAGDPDNAEFARRLAALPLAYQPGTTWDYSYSTDVLGRVVEVASGQTLGAFLQERIFTPLGMTDTAFVVSDPARQARLAEPLADDRSIGVGVDISDPRQPTRLESGGGGLVSTAADYARFLQMLMAGGTLDGKRILGPQTLAFMTADHTGEGIARTPLYLPGPGYGFGLGFAVRTAAGDAAIPGAVGEYYWGGAGGTYMWVDPANELFAILMVQTPKHRTAYRSLVRNMVYAAIED
ncbi:beta-lactamase family protein [Achromobacter sp. GG226]|uniref:serine hydrolase domain-containing protein n=1 Tax=Verticiella alkaliphila TaxID=2779529 RepID=UPI001C0DAF2B|nr:serine hydrolase domain-containing protein [Verticiella sp. GG226]MBU4609610.1 beta-lactamase family protein [Verticiella sp. GG226]